MIFIFVFVFFLLYVKMLEVWHEIKVELEQENIRPVSPDVDNMMEISRILDDRAAGVSATQVCLREGRERTNRGRSEMM